MQIINEVYVRFTLGPYFKALYCGFKYNRLLVFYSDIWRYIS